ncbi:hypothetical protein [Desulfuribacillus alkaliarsenatis]|uniref:Uncharacterized protein n=1 Tax=Desulfuribacillus alkaliarsenatis TaxID=766136 RepID=A0A1E5FYS4_9FIRM|nr:hypothetical protein [Desulfuribacillus alkaliarsenatis]OEF95735.1 hypothetical protein BHF68_11595 [Desulfuribacillus alkaliarsenatis]
MNPIYKAWNVVEIEEPEQWHAKKKQVWDKPVICYVDGLDAKVVTVFKKNTKDFPEAKAEEALWDIFAEPCLYLSNEDFGHFIHSWEKFIDLQKEFWFQIATENKQKINVSLMRKAFITIGSYKLLQLNNSSKKTYISEQKLTALMSLLAEIYDDVNGKKLTIWGTDEQLIEKLQEKGVQVQAIAIDTNNKRSQLINSVEDADGLIILNDCDKVRGISMQPVLERMNEKVIIDTCYIYELAEIEKLGARLVYC